MTRSIRVLHVDDDPGFGELAANFLESESDRIEVVSETNADDGLETLRDAGVDCVVSDHDMPGKDGIEFLEAVREDDPVLPFILFTGKGSEEIASKAVSADVTDYLQKETGTEQYTLLANRITNAVERFRSRRAAGKRKRRLETLISNLPGLVYRCRNEPAWPMEYVEGECEQLTGYPSEKVESDAIAWGEDVIHPEDRRAIWREVQSALDEREPFECTYRIVTADGAVRWVWERGRGVYSADDELDGLEGFITDITESKERERRFEAIFDNTYQFTGLMEPDGTLIEANETALAAGGLDREEVVGEPIWETHWFQSSQNARDIVRNAVQKARRGELFRDEIRVQGSGEEAIVDFSVRPVTDERGDVTLLIPEGRNITARKERERERRRNERRFEAIFDDPNVLVGLLDPAGATLDVNRTAMEYVDADRSEVIGEPFWKTPWWDGESGRDVERWIARAADGEYVDYEVDHLPSGGISVEGSLRPVTDGETVTAILASARDVTERREREREIEAQNERFDEFASFVSHDLQSSISTARGRLELALETGDAAHVEKAAEAIERVDELRTDFADVLRTGEIVGDAEEIDVRAAIERAWATVDPPGTASYDVVGTTRVEGDPGAVRRLLENLVSNSVEHAGSDVRVRVGPFEDGFYYEDDGPGIDPESRSNVFTPGFSAKDGEAGIGTGMASVRQIVLAHDWTIRIEDGQTLDGVRFEVRSKRT